MLDLNGKFPVGALIFGAIFSFALSYGEDVYKNLSDGFDLSDFNTFDGNEFKYICAAIGGAISGVLGAYDKIYLSFIGDFVGNMVENAYTFSDWKNVGKAIWTSLIAGSVSGISTAISNRLTKLYFDNKVVNSSNEVQKEMKKFMKKIQNSNSNTLVKLPSNTLVGELINNTLKYKKVVSKIFSFLYDGHVINLG